MELVSNSAAVRIELIPAISLIILTTGKVPFSSLMYSIANAVTRLAFNLRINSGEIIGNCSGEKRICPGRKKSISLKVGGATFINIFAL